MGLPDAALARVATQEATLLNSGLSQCQGSLQESLIEGLHLRVAFTSGLGGPFRPNLPLVPSFEDAKELKHACGGTGSQEGGGRSPAEVSKGLGTKAQRRVRLPQFGPGDAWKRWKKLIASGRTGGDGFKTRRMTHL